MPDHKIALITDSTCDLPRALREQYAINVLPLTIIWGNEQLRDGVDIQPEAFYERLATDPVYPTTSQPTPQDFLDIYEAPDAETAARVSMISLSGGATAAESWTAIPYRKFLEIIEGL